MPERRPIDPVLFTFERVNKECIFKIAFLRNADVPDPVSLRAHFTVFAARKRVPGLGNQLYSKSKRLSCSPDGVASLVCSCLSITLCVIYFLQVVECENYGFRGTHEKGDTERFFIEDLELSLVKLCSKIGSQEL